MSTTKIIALSVAVGCLFTGCRQDIPTVPKSAKLVGIWESYYPDTFSGRTGWTIITPTDSTYLQFKSGCNSGQTMHPCKYNASIDSIFNVVSCEIGGEGTFWGKYNAKTDEIEGWRHWVEGIPTITPGKYTWIPVTMKLYLRRY